MGKIRMSRDVKKIDFDADLRIIRGEVFASMKARTYTNQIFLNSDFQIERATCKCPRGLQICHHIAVTLFAAHYDLSKTDVSCSWVPTPKDDDDVKTIDELFNIKKPNRVTNRNLEDAELDELYQSLLTVQPVGFRWILRSYFQDDDEDKGGNENVNAVLDSIDIRCILLSKEANQAPNKTEFLIQKLKLTGDIIQNVQTLTVGQADNLNWHIVRSNLITASLFGRVIDSINRNRYPPSLYTALLSKKDLRKVQAVECGIIHEKDGLNVLSQNINKEIKACELFLSASGVLGASPDGLIDDDYVVEIKCPFKFRKCLLTEALRNDRSYVFFYNDKGELSLNKKHPYYHQLQGQIYLSGRKGCHLCVWTPKQAICCEILKDRTWFTNLEKIEKFYFDKFVPIHTQSIKN